MNAVLGRAVQAGLTVFGALTIVFLILRLTPGDPVRIILGEYATPELLATVRQQYGLDRSIPEQYLIYLKNSATGNFGRSLALRTSVTTLIGAALPSTIALALSSLLITVIIGLPLGIISALKRNTLADYSAMVIALLGIAAPNFWVALLMIYFLSYKFGWFPIQGAGQAGDYLAQLHHLVLPALALGSRSAALVARTTRSAMLDVLGEDYVRTARSKGLAERAVVRAHVLRNALIPVITVLGIYFGQLLGGATVIEIVFGRPGLGKLLVDSILNRDYPLSQALIVTFLVVIVLVNLLTDAMYSVIDPRIRAS